MTDASALEITERCLFFSGVFFLIVATVLVLVHMGAYFRRRSRWRQTPSALGTPSYSWLTSLFTASTLAFFSSILAFLALAFSPLAPFENFSRHESLPQRPLDLTALGHTTSGDGVLIEGSVLNTARRELATVDVLVLVFDRQGQLLQEKRSVVEPAPLASRAVGSFRVPFEKVASNLYSYSVSFSGHDGSPIPHVDRRR